MAPKTTPPREITSSAIAVKTPPDELARRFFSSLKMIASVESGMAVIPRFRTGQTFSHKLQSMHTFISTWG